jgi:hypothetical protein
MIKDEGRQKNRKQSIYARILMIDWCLTPTLAIFQLYRDVNLDEGGWKF